MKTEFYSLCIILLLSAQTVFAQTQTVTGTVTDADREETLPGVTVVVQGTNIGTSTGSDGMYEINVPPEGEVLVFSFIGYRTEEVPIDGQEVIDVALTQDLLGLDELIVTALGLQVDRRQLGFSVQSLQGQQIAQTQQVSMSDGIAGQISGVTVRSQAGVPGGGTSVNIRGRASLLGDNEPLYVIDGIPINDAMRTTVSFSSVDVSNRAIDINPNDIASMSVLKGPAASALYGIQGANGAIIIETKAGGESNVPTTTINYNTRVGIEQVNQLYELQSEFGPGGSDGVYNPFSPNSWGPRLDTMSYDGNPDPQYPIHPNGRLVSQNDPEATGQEVEIYDNLNNFFEDALTSSHHVSVSTGTRDRNLYASFGRTDDGGAIPNTWFRRNTFTVRGNASFFDRMNIGAGVQYSNSGGQRAGRGSNFAGIMIPLTRTPITFDNAGGVDDPANDEAAWKYPDGTQRNFLQGQGGPDQPYWIVNEQSFRDDVNRLIGHFNTSFNINEWLNATYRFGGDVFSDRRRHNFNLGSQSGDGSRGRRFDDLYIDRNFNSDFLLTANQSFGARWDLQAIAGHNYFRAESERLYADARGMVQPNFFHIANMQENPSVQQGTDQKETVAVFGNLNLNYDDQLFIDITGRNEWSSTLPADNNSFFYPSLSLAYVFTEGLDFFDGSPLNYGQLRVSVAEVGNDAPLFITESYFNSATATEGYGNGISFPFQGIAAFTESASLGNPEIKPERNRSFEVGTDLRFFDQQLNIDFTYYYSSNKDQIFPVSISPSSGYNSRFINAGELTNEGIELSVSAVPFQTDDFQWTSQINFTRNRNIVQSLTEGIESIELGGVGGNIVPRLEPGQPYGVFYGRGFERNDDGQKIIGDDGYPIVTDEQIVLGDPNPDFELGFSNNLSFRNLSLNFLWDVRYGNDVWNGPEALFRFRGQSKLTETRGETHVFDGVRLDGSTNNQEVILDQSYYQGIDNYFVSNENFVEDGSWLRLRSARLSYSIPVDLVGALGLSSANLTLYGRNLLLFTPYSGIDPDTNLYGRNQSMGIDYYNNPSRRGFGVELDISF